MIIYPCTVKHEYFASIKFSQFSKFKYTQIFQIAHHHDFVCIEYELFHDIISNILGRFNVSNNTGQISIITFV